MSFFNSLSIVLSYLILILVILGGTVFKIGNLKLEIGSIDIFGSLLTLILVLTYQFHPLNFHENRTFLYISKFIKKISTKKYFYFLFICSILIITVIHIFKNITLNTDGSDQSFVNQALFHVFSSPTLKCDLCNYQSYLSEHLAFTLYLLAPITTWLHSNELIFLIETMVIMGAIYLLIKTTLKDRSQLWAYALLIILTNRSLRASIIWDFREDHLGFAFMSLALISLYRKNLILYTISILAVLLSKENFPYLLPFLVFPIFLEKKLDLSKNQKWLFSIVTVISSLVWIITIAKYLGPYFNDGKPPSANIAVRFPGFGKTNTDVILNILFSPRHWKKLIVERVLTAGTFKYLLFFLAPYFYFLRKRWWWIIATLPVLAMNTLSYANTQRMMIFHYDLIILPLLIMGVLLTLQEKSAHSPKTLFWGFIFAVMLSGRWPMFYFWKYIPSKSDLQSFSYLHSIRVNQMLGADRRLMAQITPNNEQCDLRIPLSKNKSWDAFWKFNTPTKPEQSRYGCVNPTFLLLDTSNKWQNFIYNKALERNWSQLSHSPNNKFVLIKKDL